MEFSDTNSSRIPEEFRGWISPIKIQITRAVYNLFFPLFQRHSIYIPSFFWKGMNVIYNLRLYIILSGLAKAALSNRSVMKATCVV